MTIETTATVKDLLNSKKKIVVVSHKNPDGDAIGSSLGLAYFLKKTGHSVTVMMPNDFPDFLKWLPGAESILIFEKEKEKTLTAIKNAEVIFTLDFNSFSRIGDLQKPMEESKAAFVLIDHHQKPDGFALATYSDVLMSSTSQMIYHFIEGLEGLDHLSQEISTNLYAGIMTDTGSFRFPSTTADTHKVIAHLIERGANGSEIYQNIYDINTPDRMRLLGKALENLKLLPEFKTAYISLTQKELDDHNFKKGDTEGFVNYALSVKDIVFAVIFIENKQENIVKLSLRSKGNFSVNDFARKHYEGGGHTNAAGGRSSHSLRKTISEFITILPHYKNELSNGA